MTALTRIASVLLLTGCTSGIAGLSSLGREANVTPLRGQPGEQLHAGQDRFGIREALGQGGLGRRAALQECFVEEAADLSLVSRLAEGSTCPAWSPSEPQDGRSRGGPISGAGPRCVLTRSVSVHALQSLPM